MYFVHNSSVVDDGANIGDGTKIWHFSHVESGAIIGMDCVIGQGCFIAKGVTIGNGCKIQNNVSVYDGVTLEDHVFIGPSVVFTNVRNPRSLYPKNGKYERTVLKNGVTIGANATIVCGVTIGASAFVGAGTVVTKNVERGTLVIGNPARYIVNMCECGNKLHLSKETYKWECKLCHEDVY